MSHPRLTLMRGDLAAAALEGVVSAGRYGPVRAMHCTSGVAAIRQAPDAASEQQDQIIFGEVFDVLETEGEFAFGQARRDGYVGWVETGSLSPGESLPTHWVRALSTFAFAEPDLKTQVLVTLPINALVTVTGESGRFVRIAGSGWVYSDHLAAISSAEKDPAAIAEQFAGAPYLWGGRTSAGLDCSGLVQQAHYACALPSARDSEVQAALGSAIGAADLTRNDLVFWDGHVGLMTDGQTLIHANAWHMAVRAEPLADAVERSAAAGDQPSGYRRP